MAADDRLDLSQFSPALTSIFEAYPAGNLCDVCAQKVSDELKSEYKVAIMTIQNEMAPGLSGNRPPFIHGRNVDNQPFLLGQTGFHHAVSIEAENRRYFIDALVYMHYGSHAVDEATYWSLFWYSDGIEITQIQET